MRAGYIASKNPCCATFALDVCREIAQGAGYEQPVFASAELAEGLLDGLIDAHYRKHTERD